MSARRSDSDKPGRKPRDRAAAGFFRAATVRERSARQSSTKNHSLTVAARERARLVAAVAGLLMLHFILAVAGVWNKSVTYDELAHLTRGVSSFRTGDYRLGPPHPPLAHYLGALPVVVTRPRIPSLSGDDWKRSDVWTFGTRFFYGVGNNWADMLLRGRAMIALLSAGLGLLVFLWSRSIFGTAGGLLSLVLYVFDPTMLAHGSLVTTDLVAAAFFTAAMAALWRLSHRMTKANLLATVAAVGCLFLAKGSGVLIAGMGVLIIAVRVFAARQPMVFSLWGPPREIAGALRRAGVLIGLTLCLVGTTDMMLWAGYGFRWSPFLDGTNTPEGYQREAVARQRDYFTPGSPPPGQSAWDWQMRGLGPQAKFCRWIHDHKLLPDAYVYGFLAMLQSARGRDSFLNGERSLFGSQWFFPYAFAVKTPLPLFAMLIAAGAAAWLGLGLSPFEKKPGKPSPSEAPPRAAASEVPSLWQRLYPTLPVWILLLVYGATSARSTLNIGHRHLLPLYPPLLILCGAAAGWLRAAKPIRQLPYALAGLSVLATLSVFPHELAYFNWLAGGPGNGYKHLVDSSLDWGQDLPTLAAKLKRDHAGKPVYLQYFGRGSPEQTGIPPCRPIYQRLPSNGRGDLQLHGGVYCISATSFQQLYVLDMPDIREIEGAAYKPGGGMEVDWTPKYELLYQQLLPAMRQLAQLPEDPAARLDFLRQWRPNDYADAFYRFTKLRFMRLCGHLRKRAPDDMAGYSILMFNLGDDDVRRMTEGPPPYADAK